MDRRRRAPSSPVAKYYAYRVARSATFTVPIFVLFFQWRGLSLGQIGAVEATYTVVVLAFEAPTGYVSDRIGRRDSMLVGTVLSGVSVAGYALAGSFPAFLAVAALRGVAATFTSGATAAWLYETLAERDREAEFAAVTGRARTLGLATHGVAAVAGGALYGVDRLLPWVLEGAFVVAAASVLLTVREPSPASSDAATAEDAPDDDAIGVREALGVVRTTFARRTVGAFVAYTALLFGLLNTLEMYVQPVAVEVIGVAPAHLGFAYAGFTAVGAVAASQAGRVQRTLGARGWFAVAPPLFGGLLALAALWPVLAMALFFAERGLATVSRSVAGQYLNDRTPSAGRATVLSAWSMARSVATAPLNVLGGALATAVALPVALGVLGGVLLVGALAALAAWLPAADPPPSGTAADP